MGRTTPRASSWLTGLGPALTAGGVAGVLEAVLATSLAALVFSGDLAPHRPAGIGLALLGGAVVMLVIAAYSSLPFSVGSIQDTTATILALVAARITADVPGEDAFLTVVLAIAASTVLAGVFFFLLGTLRLGDLVRFVPYPVIGGFLAGTGWLLAKGAVGVLTDVPVSMATLAEVFGQATKWLPGLAPALTLVWVTRIRPHPAVIPAVSLGAVALFYLVALVTGQGVEGARAGGWLIGPFPGGGLWRPWSLEALAGADWGAVLAQAAGIGTVLVVGVLTLLLNTTGIELVTQRDVDLNRELRASGAANVAAGIGGGMVGFHALSLTTLAHRAGARTRLPGIVGAAICLATLVFGAGALSLIPKPVLGGLLLYLGLGFLIDWVVLAWRRLPRVDYALVLLILAVIAAFGFLIGVAVGTLVALAMFVVEYSRGDVVSRTVSGAAYRSNVDRDPGHLAILRERGERIHVLELQGYLFFGTASSLLDRIKERLGDARRQEVRFVVLDFRRVSGLDSSAVLGFTKVRQLASARGITLVLTRVDDRLRRGLERGGFAEDHDHGVRFLPDLDRGVQWCEDRLLEEAGAPASAEPPPLEDQLRAALGSVDPTWVLPYLEAIEVDGGETLMRQDEPSDGLYFLESGRLTVQLESPEGGRMRLRTMGPGTVVGEVTLYLGTPRTASVVAEVPSRLHRLSADALGRMERGDPTVAAAVHRMFARLLAERLTDTLREVEALLD
ncbi:MAG: SulP family inorganic anion transporter [Actinomycetota bacterium]